jgi:hypothetical protein
MITILSRPCDPLDVGSSSCLNDVALAQGVLNTFTEGLLVLMGVRMLWCLNMTPKQKVTRGCLLCLGTG